MTLRSRAFESGDLEAGGHAKGAAEGFGHALGFVAAAQVFAGGVRLGGVDEAELVQHVGGAVLVGGGAEAFIKAEDLVFEGLERFEEFIHAGVEAAGGGLELLGGSFVEEPHVFGGADEGCRTDAGTDEQWQAHLDGGGDAVVITTVRSEVEVEVFAHRRPVEEVRFIERADFATNELRVLRELMQKPGLVGCGPGHERGFQRMNDGRADAVLGDLKVGVASGFGFEDVEQARGPDHDFAVVVRLGEIEQRVIARGMEVIVFLSTARGDAGDEALSGEGLAEAFQHLGIHVVVEIEDVTGVRIQDEDHLYTIVLSGTKHPGDAALEAIPVRLFVFEGQQRSHTEAWFAEVIRQRFFGDGGPLGFRPCRGGREVFGIGDERGGGHARRWC